jgi:3-methyladenine DNA glycosylase AlkC
MEINVIFLVVNISYFYQMEPLKEMFNLAFYRDYARVFAEADKNFNAEQFLADVTRDIESLSLNGRLRNTSVMLKKHLPDDFKLALSVLYSVAPSLKRGYTALVLPDYVALYGKEDFDLSMEALRYFTTFGSAEFAIREFLKTDLKKTLQVMHQWADDENVHVRRLASEGSRPRLPWSFKLDTIIKNPSLTQGILERLNRDPELYVRKSVANHLNDHSKDNTPYLLKVLSSWDSADQYTSWIIKHASRSLIKKGDPGAMELFGFEKGLKIDMADLSFAESQLVLGDTLRFDFKLKSRELTEQKLVVDYAIHYVRSSGATSRKVFKLKELLILPGQLVLISKNQLIQDFTTRKHYPGTHKLEILLNGKPSGEASFELLKSLV